jgi:glycosyltransferase involved in cell wall biosynthesis
MRPHIAVVDVGSFVSPYVHGVVNALAERGYSVTVYASRTRYNPAFLDALRDRPGVEVVDAAVSSSVSSRWRGMVETFRLLAVLWRRRREHDTINLQFNVGGFVFMPLWWLLRRRLVYTVHNAVPHGHRARRHWPTLATAACARSLLFVSAATRDDFLHRYGERWRTRSTLVPHGLLPIAPGDAPVPVRPPEPIKGLVYWSTVKPYKGVELMADLARTGEAERRGLSLEVHGAWAHELHPLKATLVGLGVKVVDRYLDADEQRELMSRPVVFLLPYREASQSGALYTLLHQGCTVICADVGDLGDTWRRFGLNALLLQDHSAVSVWACVDALAAQRTAVRDALARAQRATDWVESMAAAWPVFDVRV